MYIWIIHMIDEQQIKKIVCFLCMCATVLFTQKIKGALDDDNGEQVV